MQWIQNRNPTNKFLVGELHCSFAINCFALFSVCCKWFRSAIPFSGELHSHCSDECAVDWMSMRVIENAKCSQYIYCLAFWIEWTAKCNEKRAHELTQEKKKRTHNIDLHSMPRKFTSRKQCFHRKCTEWKQEWELGKR